MLREAHEPTVLTTEMGSKAAWGDVVVEIVFFLIPRAWKVVSFQREDGEMVNGLWDSLGVALFCGFAQVGIQKHQTKQSICQTKTFCVSFCFLFFRFCRRSGTARVRWRSWA